MIRFLIRAAIFVASAALGLLFAAWLLPEVSLTLEGFLIGVVVFALAQSILAPFLAKMAARNAPAFLGGIGLVSTFVALLVASLITGGLTISGWRAWVLGTMIVWLVTALATFLLPLIFLRKKVSDRQGRANLPAI
jgi:MFS family permease